MNRIKQIPEQWSTGQSMWDAPYFYWKSLFTSKEVDTLNKIGDGLPPEEGTTFSGDDKTIRVGKVAWLDYSQAEWAFDTIWLSVKNTNEVPDGWNLDVRGFGEKAQYTVYDSSKEKSFYGWHQDIGPDYQHRKVSITIQLSDESEYEGGAMTLDNSGIIPHKGKGDMIMFPSVFGHEVLPVTSGIRKSLVIWLTGPKLR
jgi:PKHD-type hydroxylase